MAKKRYSAVLIQSELDKQVKRAGRMPHAFYLFPDQIEAYEKQFGAPARYKGVLIKRCDRC